MTIFYFMCFFTLTFCLDSKIDSDKILKIKHENKSYDLIEFIEDTKKKLNSMLLNKIKEIKKEFLKDPLKYLELIFLSLMLLSLPSFEAPKNIFFILFLITSLYRQYTKKTKDPCGLWDWIF